MVPTTGSLPSAHSGWGGPGLKQELRTQSRLLKRRAGTQLLGMSKLYCSVLVQVSTLFLIFASC